MSDQLSAFAVYKKTAKKKKAATKRKSKQVMRAKQDLWEVNDKDSNMSNKMKPSQNQTIGIKKKNSSDKTIHEKRKRKEIHVKQNLWEVNSKDSKTSNKMKPLQNQTVGIKMINSNDKTIHEKKKRKRKTNRPEIIVSSKKTKVSLKKSGKLKLTARNTFIVNDVIKIEDDEESDVPVLVDAQISDTDKTNLSVSEFDLNNHNAEENLFVTPENVLKFLLAPIDMEDFFENYWEKRPLHVSRKNSTYFGNLLTSEGLDKMLRENPLYYTRNVDVVTYENDERLTHNPEGRAKPASVWDYYANGCSVRVLNPQTYSHKVHTLLATLQEYFGTMVGANVYLTPYGSQGFAPHYDDIEAFVLQLEGRKHWKIYSPRSESEILPRYSSSNLLRKDLSYPLSEVTVEAGDLLYFPRGFIHEACTDSEAHSLHMTVSVYQNTAYVDLLEKLLPEALRIATRDDVEFRQGLPLHYLREMGAVNADKSSVLRNTVLNTVQKLMLKLTNHIIIDRAVDQMGRKFMYDAMPPVLSRSEKDHSGKNDGDFLENGIVRNRAEFGLATMVRLVRYHSLRLTLESDGSAKLYYCTENATTYHGEEEQILEINLGMFDVVQTLVRNYPKYMSIEDISNQNEVEKLNIIGDLWEKGLIVSKDYLDAYD